MANIDTQYLSKLLVGVDKITEKELIDGIAEHVLFWPDISVISQMNTMQLSNMATIFVDQENHQNLYIMICELIRDKLSNARY